jgi:hypothetical protein
MKKILYTRPDGGLDVVTPVINTFPVREELTEEQALSRALTRLPINAIDIQVVEETSIPSDRSFRNAWKASTGTVEVDMPKAREIHRDKLRDIRAPLLAALDVEFQRAYKDPILLDEIEVKKQALRDVTSDPAIDAATTPQELKNVIPLVLQARSL